MKRSKYHVGKRFSKLKGVFDKPETVITTADKLYSYDN